MFRRTTQDARSNPFTSSLSLASINSTSGSTTNDLPTTSTPTNNNATNLTDEEATLVEPAACAIHGADKLALPVGAEVLILGSGPTGLILSQILKLNGASKVVLAANKGIKTRIAREINAADVYIEIDRQDPQAQWDQIKKDYPYGFDAVVSPL